MRITYGIIVMNGMPFIKHQLKLIYDKAFQIIICEGGDNTWNKLHGYRRSNDGTIEFIKKFPDPLHKIRLIQKDWNNKNEMCHEYSKYAKGDIIWHVDVDEFVDPDKIPTIVNIFKNHRYCHKAAIPNFVFWGDTKTIVEAHIDGKWDKNWFAYERIFRKLPNTYIHHIPDRGYYCLKTKRIISGTQIPIKIFKDLGIYTYHYSYVLPSNVKDKIQYYNIRSPNCIKKDWLDKVFNQFKLKRDEWINTGFNVQPIDGNVYSSFDERLQNFTQTPSFLKELEKDLLKRL